MVWKLSPDVVDRSGDSGRPDRIALLIGNASYPGHRLVTPINDVEVLRHVLEQLRFDVMVVHNAKKAELELAIARFGERIDAAAPAAMSFFYFAGHGIQYASTNYLLPVDGTGIQSPHYLPARAVRVDDVVAQLVNSSCQEHVIVLDACRYNPLPSMRSTHRDVTQGLAGLHAPPPGTLIAFSTAAGAVTDEGDDPKSPYLQALEDALSQAHASNTFGDVFIAVSKLVQRRSQHIGRKQTPALYFQGHLETMLRPWEAVNADVSGRSFGDFVRVVVGAGGDRDEPHGKIPGLGLHDWFKDVDGGPEMVVVPPGSFLMGGGGSAPEHVVTIADPFAVSRFAITLAQFEQFVKDSGYRPDTKVCTREAPFGIGKYHPQSALPTVRLGRSFRRPGFPQEADHPVVGVSWNDARRYVEWLSARTDKPYRLLSEAEWEYVARAQTTTRYWWGDEIDWRQRQANYAWQWVDRGGMLRWWLRQKLAIRPRWGLSTGPVDICQPNPWGLFNVHGNVDEWVEDDWHENYDGAPADGGPWLGGGDDKSKGRRVVRGGSWGSTRGSELFAHVRAGRQQDQGYGWVGIRVARTLTPRT